MKVKAYIVIEKYVIQNYLEDLIKELTSKDIVPVLIHDVSKIEDLVKEEHPDQPILWYEHQNYSMLIDPIKDWLLTSGTHFPGIKSSLDKSILGFYPKGISQIQGCNIELKQYWFECDLIKEFKVPEVEHPRLIIFTWKRDVYFALTLNSLINSLPEKDRPPLTIVLNESTEESCQFALNKAKEYGDSADVLYITPNSKMAAICLALIWHKPKYMVALEDDFILPVITQLAYPNWPKLFVEKLNFFDVCSWCVSMDNFPFVPIPLEHLKNRYTLSKTALDGFKWAYNEAYLHMAQGLAISTDQYIKYALKAAPSAPDATIYTNVKGVCTPTLLGYHIGWNQIQDGYGNFVPSRWGDFGWNGIYDVKNLITNETRKISPSFIQLQI